MSQLRIRLSHPRRLLSVAANGQDWQLQEQHLQLAGQPLVGWRWLLIVPLRCEQQRRLWLWIWWFQLSAAELSKLRCLSMIASQARDPNKNA